MSVLDKVRRWIDGESAELVLEQAARDAQVKPRSHSEEFIVKIARAVEEVMQREMVPLPQGTTIIPTEYTIFLSNEDDKEWQGVKRKGLEQGLYHILAERAKEISGKKKLETRTFSVELRVDGTLEKGDIRVQHSWEDSSGSKTGILSRPKNLPDTQHNIAQDSTQQSSGFTPNQVQSNNVIPQNAPNFVQSKVAHPPLPTVPQLNVSQSLPVSREDPEEMTHIQTRQKELYKLEIWRSGVRQNVVPVYLSEISVGRGSKTKQVDIPLAGDPEISRRHLTIGTDGNGNYWVLNEGKNPAAINNYDLPMRQRVAVSPGVPINICSYLVRIQTRT